MSEKELKEMLCGWGEDQKFPREEWQQEVAERNKQRGYWEWVLSQQEQEDDDRRMSSSLRNSGKA